MPDMVVAVLVLGRSVVFGHALESGDQAWPYHLRDELERELGEEVTLEVRRLNPDGRDPTEYLRRMFEEVRPDVVNILPSPYDFATARVENRINELFGVRIGRMARWVEKRTTRPSTAGRAGRINRWSRRIAHRFIGARPDLTREQVERTFEAVYRFLAQQEDVTVVVRESPRPSSLVRQQNPKYVRILDEFNAEWKRKSLERHFFWSPAAEQSDDDYLRDGVHTTVSGQRTRALVLLPTMLEAIREHQRTREQGSPAIRTS